MSSKNQLQEYLHKKRLDVPIYITTKVGGTGHEPEYVSSIVLLGEKYHRTVYTYSNKSLAEKALAEIVLSSIMNKKSEKISTIGHNYIILVDIENQPNALDILDEYVDINIIYGFISKGHVLEKREHKCHMIVSVPSTRRDGADVGLILFVGTLLSKYYDHEFIIITDDKFGDTLADCLNNSSIITQDRSIKCNSFRSASAAINYFRYTSH